MLFTALSAVSVAAVALANPILEGRAPAAVYSSCTVPNTVALTFDDGPYWWLTNVVDALSNNNATGTFFFNGFNWACIYDNAGGVKYAYDRGHQVASHTWSHAHLNSLNWDQLHNEFWLVEQALQRITGASPAFMRPPYGEYNDLVREVASNRGQSVVLWDFDSGDSAGVPIDQQKQRYTDLANRRPSTALTLNHETYSSTVFDLLPHAISTLRNQGYNLVSVADCLGLPRYRSVGAPEAPNGNWHC